MSATQRANRIGVVTVRYFRDVDDKLTRAPGHRRSSDAMSIRVSSLFQIMCQKLPKKPARSTYFRVLSIAYLNSKCSGRGS